MIDVRQYTIIAVSCWPWLLANAQQEVSNPTDHYSNVRELKRGVVQVITSGGKSKIGTGFVCQLNQLGLDHGIITCSHVVTGASEIRVRPAGRQTLHVKEAFLDIEHDLALLIPKEPIPTFNVPLAILGGRIPPVCPVTTNVIG